MNILIVDDEIEIREGLRCLIEKLMGLGGNYRVLSVCASAEEALNALSQEIVDVLLTDIRMERMDGLQLAEIAKTLYPSLEVIILSGHSEFEYAQKAIKLDVSDYLLKPVRKEELQNVLTKLREKRQQMKEMTLYANADDFQKRGYAYVAIITIDDNEVGPITELPVFVQDLASDLRDVCILKGFTTKTNTNLVVGVGGHTSEQAEGLIAGVCSKIRAYTNNDGCRISAGISEIGHDRYSVHSLYLHACTAIANRLIRGSGIWNYTPKVFNEKLYQVDLSRINTLWDTLDFAAIYEEIGRLVSTSAEKEEVSVLIWTINTVMITLNEKVKNFNHLNETISYELSGFLFKILWCRSMFDLNSVLLHRIKELLYNISPERREGPIIQKAKQFIKQHLHEQISLTDISREVCVTVSYLSRLFRDKTGCTFLEYLTRERINIARELLADPSVKIYEVTGKVGFGSWKHFSRTFKNVTGYTPSEYRKCLVTQKQ